MPFAAAQPAPSAPPREPAAAAPAEAIEEASYEDDLWGAFELEEIPKSPATAPAAAFGAVAADSEFEAEEFFSFEDESEAIEETGPALDFGAASSEPAPLQTAEELFSFADESPIGAASAFQPDPNNFPVEEPFSFEPEAEQRDSSRTGTVPFSESFAPVSPVAAPLAQGTPEFPGELPPVQAQPAPFALSEADLVAALSKVSREVIERIVWEVVPDLAEVLIKEEIRKLRAGIKE